MCFSELNPVATLARQLACEQPFASTLIAHGFQIAGADDRSAANEAAAVCRSQAEAGAA